MGDIDVELKLKNESMLLIHNGEEVDFGQFKPKKPTASDDPAVRKLTPAKYAARLSEAMFTEINGYWNTLDKKELDLLFAIYMDAYDDIIESPTDSERHLRVRESIEKIVDGYHKFENVEEFMADKPVVPTKNVKESFDSSIHDSISRQTTYIMSEYRQLATLTVIFRAIAPIWNLSGRMTTVPNEKAGKVYYEMEMFSTLANTELLTTDAFLRLEEFVNAQWDKWENGKNKQDAKGSILSSVVAGLGTSDIPHYLLATSVVNKLAVREINTFRDEGDLITHVWQRIDTEVKKLAVKFARLKAKVSKRLGEDEDKTGYLDSFRTREKTRRDVYILAQYYLYDYRAVKRALDDEIPASLVKACIDSFNKHKPSPIRPAQKVMVQWVLSKIVHHRAIPHVDRHAMINAMGVVQAALIHWRMRHNAALMSASPAPVDDDGILITTPLDAVSIDVRQRLSEVYPYYRHSKNTTARRQLCPGLQATEEFTKLFADQEWVLNCTPKLEEELRQKCGVFKPASSLKSEVAELLIKINR